MDQGELRNCVTGTHVRVLILVNEGTDSLCCLVYSVYLVVALGRGGTRFVSDRLAGLRAAPSRWHLSWRSFRAHSCHSVPSRTDFRRSAGPLADGTKIEEAYG